MTFPEKFHTQITYSRLPERQEALLGEARGQPYFFGRGQANFLGGGRRSKEQIWGQLSPRPPWLRACFRL